MHQQTTVEKVKSKLFHLKQYSRPYIAKRLAKIAWDIGAFLGSEVEEVLLLTGSARSGTTWVMELLEEIPGTCHIMEPFAREKIPPPSDPRRFKEIARCNFGLGFRPYLSLEEENPALETFLCHLMGRLNSFPSWGLGISHFSLPEIIERYSSPKRLIVKCTRAQRLLPWILRRFSTKSILLMRHPLAVVASQLHHPYWQHDLVDKEHPIITKEVERDYPDLVEYAAGLVHIEEKLAATWCFDYLIPLENWDNCRDALLVTYEQLVTEPESVLDAMQDYIGIEFPKTVFHKLGKPSAATVEDSLVMSGMNPLTTWQDRLSSEEISRTLRVVEGFGLSFYSEDPEPDLKELRISFTDPSNRRGTLSARPKSL